MTALEKIKAWISTYPGFEDLSKFQVDYINHVDPGSGSISPSGLVEIGRKRDILGNTTIINQYNFGLYYVFAKDPGDDIGATINADWVMGFQEWVQEQSAKGLSPTFGNEKHTEQISAQNGMLYEVSPDGVATYLVQLSVQFKLRLERKVN